MYECSNSPDYLALQQALAALPEDQRAPYNIVWTKSMKRLFTLVGHCLRHKEPVLLVGETGCGKTTGMMPTYLPPSRSYQSIKQSR